MSIGGLTLNQRSLYEQRLTCLRHTDLANHCAPSGVGHRTQTLVDPDTLFGVMVRKKANFPSCVDLDC